MADHSKMQLGKKDPKVDNRTLRLAKYLKSDLPPPPDSVDWTKGEISFGMMLNDQLGDCTIAACAHAVQIWTANSSKQVTIPDSDILKAYEDWDGYNKYDPDSDKGGVEIDVLNAWRKNGLAGHHILAYVDPDPKNILHIKQSVALFGGVYIGLALPLTAQSQNIWYAVQGGGVLTRIKRLFAHEDPAAPNSWGGHAVYVPAYNVTGPICITWGQLKQMTWNFWQKYCDEAHTLLSEDWTSVTSPAGTTVFDQATLQADLREVVA
jgi:hypothetical protein